MKKKTKSLATKNIWKWEQKLCVDSLQVGLLNVDGYYNSLLSFIDKAVDEGFVTPAARHIIVSAQTAHELMSKLEVFPKLNLLHLIISEKEKLLDTMSYLTLQSYSPLNFIKLKKI